MTVEEIKEQIDKEKVIAIVRGVSTEKCMKVAEALYEGGIRLMEVPFNPKDPASDEVIADCIADCIWHYDEKKDEISARVLKLTEEFPLYQ